MYLRICNWFVLRQLWPYQLWIPVCSCLDVVSVHILTCVCTVPLCSVLINGAAAARFSGNFLTLFLASAVSTQSDSVCQRFYISKRTDLNWRSFHAALLENSPFCNTFSAVTLKTSLKLLTFTFRCLQSLKLGNSKYFYSSF